MIIVEDERNIMNAGESIGICIDCGKTKVGRQVKTSGMLNTDRGYYFVCFDCLKPRIFWRKEPGGRLYNSPAE